MRGQFNKGQFQAKNQAGLTLCGGDMAFLSLLCMGSIILLCSFLCFFLCSFMAASFTRIVARWLVMIVLTAILLAIVLLAVIVAGGEKE